MDDTELNDSEYLRDLAERIFRIPVFNGVDGYDYDRLREIARRLQPPTSPQKSD